MAVAISDLVTVRVLRHRVRIRISGEKSVRPLIITAAITGGGKPKARSPYQPATPRELVDCAIASWRAGAAIVHIHARDENGETTSDPGRHREICKEIRKRGSDVIINFSAGDDGGKADHETRLAIVRDGGGEMASLSCGSFNTGFRLYDNRPAYLERSARLMLENGTRPEIEIVDTGNLYLLGHYVERGLIPVPSLVQFGFGLTGGMPPNTELLGMMVSRLPRGLEWGVICQSASHEDYLRMAMASFSLGGHIRTGMEDTPMRTSQIPAESNAELVTQWVETAKIWGRPVADPASARQMLGIPAL